MGNKQIKDFQKTDSIASTELFLKSTTDGGLSTVDYGTIKKDIINNFKSNEPTNNVKFYTGIATKITIETADVSPWGIGFIMVDGSPLKTIKLHPDTLVTDLGDNMSLVYDVDSKIYTLEGLPGYMTLLCLAGGVSNSKVTVINSMIN